MRLSPIITQDPVHGVIYSLHLKKQEYDEIAYALLQLEKKREDRREQYHVRKRRMEAEAEAKAAATGQEVVQKPRGRPRKQVVEISTLSNLAPQWTPFQIPQTPQYYHPLPPPVPPLNMSSLPFPILTPHAMQSVSCGQGM